jgi:capsular exopolysaccharide synthesis family protein
LRQGFESLQTEALSAEEPSRDVHLADYWAVFWKRRVLIGLCVGVVLVATIVKTFLAVPLFKATVILDVEKDKGSPLDVGGTQFYDWYQPEFLPTQTRLMQSRQVAERVVKRLSLAENEEFNPPSRWAEKKKPGSVEKAPASDPTPRLAQAVQGGIETTPIRGSNLVELSYVSTSPKLAADIANAVADAYIEWNTESKYRMVGQASQFLGAQIEKLKGEVDETEKKLQAYSRQKDIVSMDPQANITMQKLESLNKDYTAAMGDRVSKEAKYYELQTARPEATAETLSSGLIPQLRNEQARLEREYAEKLNLFKPEWPAMQQLRSQIQKGKQHLDSVILETVTKAREQAQIEYQTALRKEESLKEVLRSQKLEAMTLNSNAVEYTNLKVEVSTKRTLLDSLLKRQSETEVASRLSGQRESNIRIVDRALLPTSKFSPSYRKNGMMGLLLGLAAGVGLAFFLEYMDRSLRKPEQVEQYLGLPALGVIPTVGLSHKKGYGYGGYGYGGYGYDNRRKKSKPATASGVEELPPSIELLPHEHPRSTTAEAYRAFRAALLLSRAGGVQSLVITSGFPSEGKTSTAVNLGIVLAQLGKSVLLIDADLHKPRLHEILKLSNRTGLVSILAEEVEPTRAIQATQVPGLSCITSGPGTPNPSGLLSSEAMEKLLEFARMNFDYVITDSPPVQAVADALILGAHTNGVVLCVKAGKTPREQVARARDVLRLSNVRILGVLLNNLAEKGPGYGGKYYYRSGTELAYGDVQPEAQKKVAERVKRA